MCLPLICSYNPEKKTRVVVLSAGHKQLVLTPKQKTSLHNCGTTESGHLSYYRHRGEVGSGRRRQGKEVWLHQINSPSSHTSPSLEVTVDILRPLGLGANSTSDPHRRVDTSKGKQLPRAIGDVTGASRYR